MRITHRGSGTWWSETSWWSGTWWSGTWWSGTQQLLTLSSSFMPLSELEEEPGGLWVELKCKCSTAGLAELGPPQEGDGIILLEGMESGDQGYNCDCKKDDVGDCGTD